MKIALHLMEPWLIENQFAKYNLGESGIEDKTLGEILEITNTSMDELKQCSFMNNDTYGSEKLRKIIASFYENVQPENILVTTGVSEALFIYFHLRYEEGANVIIPFPAFQTLYEVPRYLGYDVRLLQLEPEENFRINIDKLEELIDENTKMIVLNNPHNPTGMKLTDHEIQEISNLAEKHGIEILADEHYRFIPYSDDALIPSIYDKAKNVVAAGSMIKCLGCVGLRVGWIIGSRDLIESCRDFKDYTTHTISSMNDFISQKLLLSSEKITKEHKIWIRENISEFNKFLSNHKDFIGCVEPQGGIVAFPFIKDKSISSQEFAKKLVEKTEVSVLPGEAFEMPGHFRIGFGIKPETFKKAMELMSEFIDSKSWK
ncbi:guanitoxin biosynthesis PLP-dependent (S)-gamma-hydroxy-L-arginine cyclodehydratase GntC [Oceanirhabdus sp. W0125-5]|uniref:guanitoxin biosynthesis PLP-dependent (S)-gamma-hydroxy-L-arginine cyclodehydratase GntC n=1 Tax=Oceanirhabdus sp. W0125-5 TaxID=2999116 RepID=UPI0022F2AD0B|nr:guanitoxin biosynthesis PLP-dependent (S)-gamma-hydroxy-L-arginine cyclodehydratase GntC [Oceanirhabdus sp. W0125-5]WBW96391.1 guanitoxin biosynthesis PLP-dependent (S)-gamma-hydroxy-L-arginine cyclodehydratase GntC [Oceanirhabdus sp. W0125-5]